MKSATPNDNERLPDESPDSAAWRGRRPGNLHEAFLNRAGEAEHDPRAGSYALGAFLTMRLADQFGHGVEPPQDAVRYQVDATRDFLRSLAPQTVETVQLLEITRAADTAHTTGEARRLWTPLLTFAAWLEEAIRLSEALDVLETALRLSDGRDGPEEIAASLQRARVYRKAGRFREATAAYTLAGERAERAGDRHAARLSRIGRGIVMQKTGELPASETLLREVLAEARADSDVNAEARACQDLACVMILMNRPAAAVPMAFRAYEAYEDIGARLRALSDVGMAFKMLGNLVAARDAFEIVIEGHESDDVKVNAILELIEVAARAGDRMAFERFRRELSERETTIAPDQRVDLAIKVGTGYAVFGQTVRAATALREAVSEAEAYGLNTYLSVAERLLDHVEGGAARALFADSAVDGIDPREEAEANGVAVRLSALRVS